MGRIGVFSRPPEHEAKRFIEEGKDEYLRV